MEREDIKRISVNYNLFTQICKMGYLVDMNENGRAEITFGGSDILKFYNGLMVEKEYNGQLYQFLLLEIDATDKVEIIKRSPLFQGVLERI